MFRKIKVTRKFYQISFAQVSLEVTKGNYWKNKNEVARSTWIFLPNVLLILKEISSSLSV